MIWLIVVPVAVVLGAIVWAVKIDIEADFNPTRDKLRRYNRK